MTSHPPRSVLAKIIALSGDQRPGVTRLAMEALSALSGIDQPSPTIIMSVRRRLKPRAGGAEL